MLMLVLLRRRRRVRVRPDSVARTVFHDREEAGVVFHIVGRIARRPLASHSAFEVVPVFANVRIPRLGQRLQRVGVLL